MWLKYDPGVSLRPPLLLLPLVWIALFSSGCGVEFGGGPAGDFKPVQSRVLTVATEKVPAAGFWLGTPEHPTGGFEYGLARSMAERFGLDRVEVRTVPFEKMIAGDLGGADLGLRQLTPTDEREENLEFSIPYISAAPAALTRAGRSIPDLKTARDLTWAVPKGTTLVDTLRERVRPETMTIGADRGAVVGMVLDGDADAALFDLPVAMALARASGGVLEVAAQFSGDEALAAALPKGSPNLEAINSAIRSLTSDGTISGLAEEWLGEQLQAGSFAVPGIPLIR